MNASTSNGDPSTIEQRHNAAGALLAKDLERIAETVKTLWPVTRRDMALLLKEVAATLRETEADQAGSDSKRRGACKHNSLAQDGE
jgi:hypothetical protein